MTIPSDQFSPRALMAINDEERLLAALKDLKNSIIGSTWKKVEVADEVGVLDFLLDHLSPGTNDWIRLSIATEVAVIIGVVANEGSLTTFQLLKASTPDRLLRLIREITSDPSPKAANLISAALRALRNVLISTADEAWGEMWGSRQEKRVVGTGLVGPEEGHVRIAEDGSTGEGSSKRRSRAVHLYEAELGMVFRADNLTALLSLLRPGSSPHVVLPLYQLFARLASLPSHRRTLASWNRSSTPDNTTPRSSYKEPPSYMISHLVDVINQKPNAKILEAALYLSATLVKDDPALASEICFGLKDDSTLAKSRYRSAAIGETIRPAADFSPSATLCVLNDLLQTSQTPVRIAAAACLTNIATAEPKYQTFNLVPPIGPNVIFAISQLMLTDDIEERIKLCFIFAGLISDDASLQKLATQQGSLELVTKLLATIEGQSEGGELSLSIIERGREAAFMALAALAFNQESNRATIAERPYADWLCDGLKNPSVGVRAAACQLVRALSRTVSLVRTTIWDSGIAHVLLSLLEYKKADRPAIKGFTDRDTAGISYEDYDWSDSACVIEITALQALCNLVVDFCPMKEAFLRHRALKSVCIYADCPSVTVAVGALWALKNTMFKSSESDKSAILKTLTVQVLMKHTSPSAPVAVNIQAFGVIQNYLADGTLADLSKAVETLGEAQLFDAIQAGLKKENSPELRTAAFAVLVNLCWGNERLRQTVVNHDFIVEALVDAINSQGDGLVFLALKSIRNLITSTTRSERPRMAIYAPFRSYNITPRVRMLAEHCPSLDVSTAALALQDVLDKVKPGGLPSVEDPLDK